MRFIKYIFTPNHEKYEGVRPVNIYLLRLFFFLMFAFVATDAWTGIFTHQGAWDHHRAMNTAVWAAYTTLGFFGIFKPLRWLPIMVFMILYKTIWSIVVAYPLWRAGTLAGSPAEEMARVYMGAPLAILFIPWVYFFKTFIMGRKPGE